MDDDPAGSAPEGVRWRALSLADIPAMTLLFAQIEAVDRYGWHFDAAFLTRWMEDPLIDLARGTLGAFDGERMVAAGVLAARTAAQPVHAMRYEGGVHPDYRGRGLGSALMAWIDRTAPRLHHGRFPGRPLEVHLSFKQSDRDATALFSAHGYQIARFFHTMEHDLDPALLPPVRVPEGIRVVDYEPALDARVLAAKNAAFRDHWNITPTTPEAWRARFVGPEFRPQLSPLALDAASGEVLGLIITHVHDAMTAATGKRDAHVNNVATVRAARGRGVASALIATMLRAARAEGYDTASLEVDSENATGALGVYTRAGFKLTDTWVHYAKPFAVAEG